MTKYAGAEIVFQEVPDKVTLAIAIANCQGRCAGCHSPQLREDIGRDLEQDIEDLLDEYYDVVNCVCFMGCGNDPDSLMRCIAIAKMKGYETCLYVGDEQADVKLLPFLDYIKVGAYDDLSGGLNKDTTNQRMYQLIDITDKFRRKPC